jgi:hypothetical protein
MTSGLSSPQRDLANRRYVDEEPLTGIATDLGVTVAPSVSA